MMPDTTSRHRSRHHEERQPRSARSSDLPSSFPAWAKQLAELYFSGTTSAFVLHGNTYDYVRSPGGETDEYVGLAEFLAEQLFGRWSLVLHYDLGRGLRVAAGRNEQRLKEMVTLANRKVGDLSTLSKEPSATIALLDRFVRNNLMAAEADRLSLAVIVDQASYVFPVRRPRPPEPAGIVAARDDDQLGDEPAREAAEHGVRAGGRKARRSQRAPHQQSARRVDRGAAAGGSRARSIHQRHRRSRRRSRRSPTTTPRSWPR